jgi:hypothetical protein
MAEHRGTVLVRRVERLTTGRFVPEEIPGRAMRLTAVVALLSLILLAPRAAIGAGLPERGHFFSARVPDSKGIFLFRRSDLPVLDGQSGRQFEAVLVRVGGR